MKKLIKVYLLIEHFQVVLYVKKKPTKHWKVLI